MPLYVYRCTSGHECEVLVAHEAAEPQECPECGAPLHRQWSAPRVIFRGTGFHATDYPSTRRRAAVHE